MNGQQYLKNGASGRPLMDVPSVPNILHVLLFSSLPRSGSTVVAELLATHPNSVLFFEPLSSQKKNPCARDGSCVASFLTRLFKCTFDQNFENWLKGKGLFLKYFNPTTRQCIERPWEGGSACRHKLHLNVMCKNASVRIVKVIRSRLPWLVNLLNNTSLNVKIIHLIRDPRGSLNSMQRLNWNSKPSLRCGNLEDDMREYNKLLKKYPTKVKMINLEMFSVDPYSTTSDIHKFLYGSPGLEERTLQYLKEHTRARKTLFFVDNMDTHKNSSREYQAWRWRITSQLLRETEEELACSYVINELGHAMFGSLHNARNLTLPLDKRHKQY
ncbi:hypothetical protein OTU49_016926 [Cherax quadricarinatus]|uniref:Sulfotransferase domain-containing protein n=1 Tax=Cherax quadricarinatus TaxID=27406 RepID=A0AAW0Y4J0_CHEQU